MREAAEEERPATTLGKRRERELQLKQMNQEIKLRSTGKK